MEGCVLIGQRCESVSSFMCLLGPFTKTWEHNTAATSFFFLFLFFPHAHEQKCSEPRTYGSNSLSLHSGLVCLSIRYGDSSESLFSVGGIFYQKTASANKASPDTRPEIAMDMI